MTRYFCIAANYFFAYSDSLAGLLVHLNISLHVSAEDLELRLQGFFFGISHCSALQRNIFILWFLCLYRERSWEKDGKTKTDSKPGGPSRWPGPGCLSAAFVGTKKKCTGHDRTKCTLPRCFSPFGKGQNCFSVPPTLPSCLILNCS